MHGDLTNQEMDLFLKQQYIGRIGCHENDITYIVPISYAYDGKNIYCHSQEGMKINMLRKNPELCFEVDKLDHVATWKSVIIWGRFEEMQKEEERIIALKILLSRAYPFIVSKKMKLGTDWPFVPDNLNNIKGIVFKIQIKKMSGKFESNDEPWDYLKG